MQDEKTGESIHYEVIVLGTGLKQCILGGLLATEGRKALHIDRNDFYGGHSASFNLNQCRENEELKEVSASADLSADDFKAQVGRSKDFSIDLCPKFLMAGGDLVKMLLKTKVTKYLDFQSIGGSYVYNKDKSALLEVPMTAKQAWNSSLLSMMEKKNFGSFLSYVNGIEVENKQTWKASGLGWSRTFNLVTETPEEVFKYFKLGKKCAEFVGHAVCLYPTDSYLTYKDKNGRTKMLDCVKRMHLYLTSSQIYPETTSPYLYPMWGLGGLSEGFARLGAVHGSVFMLRRPVTEILYNEDGTVKGAVSEGETATCDIMIVDPSYLEGTDKIKSSGFVASTIMVLDRVLPGVEDASAQVIFPTNQTGHNCDVYLTMVGKDLECAAPDKYVAVASTRVASAEDMGPIEFVRQFMIEKEVNILAEFHAIRETFVGCNQQAGDNIYICSSPDHTTHFQTATREVLNLYHAIAGKPLDLTKLPKDDE